MSIFSYLRGKRGFYTMRLYTIGSRWRLWDSLILSPFRSSHQHRKRQNQRNCKRIHENKARRERSLQKDGWRGGQCSYTKLFSEPYELDWKSSAVLLLLNHTREYHQVKTHPIRSSYLAHPTKTYTACSPCYLCHQPRRCFFFFRIRWLMFLLFSN